MTLHLTTDREGRLRQTMCGKQVYPSLAMTPEQHKALCDPRGPACNKHGLYVCRDCHRNASAAAERVKGRRA
jgi:hypothetical protein